MKSNESKMESWHQDIDHAVVIVESLEHAGRVFTQLGFTVTERSEQKNLGTANRLVVLQDQYIEILAVEEPNSKNEFLYDIVRKRQGPIGVTMSTSDANISYERLLASSVSASAPFEFARDVETANGPEEASFRVFFLEKNNTPGAMVSVCQHYTPQLIWRKGWMEHANGAVGLTGIIAIVTDLPKTLVSLVQLYGKENVQNIDGSIIVTLEKTQNEYHTIDSFSQRYPDVPVLMADEEQMIGIKIRVKNLDLAQEVIQKNDIPHQRISNTSLHILPSTAIGSLLELTE